MNQHQESFQHKTEDKLIILYVLYKIKTGLSREQIAFIIIQNLQIAYMTIQLYIDDLIKENFIHDSDDGKLVITPEGSAMIEQLSDHITSFTREMIDSFIANNRKEIFRETKTSATYTERSPNDFQVKLSLSENSMNLLSLTVSCPDKAQALALCDNWREHTQEIYAQIMGTLINPDAEA